MPVKQKSTYRNMAKSELLCVRVAILLGNKYASTKSDVIKAVRVRIGKIFFYSMQMQD